MRASGVIASPLGRSIAGWVSHPLDRPVRVDPVDGLLAQLQRRSVVAVERVGEPDPIRGYPRTTSLGLLYRFPSKRSVSTSIWPVFRSVRTTRRRPCGPNSAPSQLISRPCASKVLPLVRPLSSRKTESSPPGASRWIRLPMMSLKYRTPSASNAGPSSRQVRTAMPRAPPGASSEVGGGVRVRSIRSVMSGVPGGSDGGEGPGGSLPRYGSSPDVARPRILTPRPVVGHPPAILHTAPGSLGDEAGGGRVEGDAIDGGLQCRQVDRLHQVDGEAGGPADLHIVGRAEPRESDGRHRLRRRERPG